MIFDKPSDLDFIHPSQNPKYSMNLHAFLMGRKNLGHDWVAALMRGPAGPGGPDVLHIGWVFDHELQGAKISTVLRDGKRASTWCFTDPFSIVVGFWNDYTARGRCVFDPEHRNGFIGDKDRFVRNGDRRICTWCAAEQQIERWTETVVRERWIDVERTMP